MVAEKDRRLRIDAAADMTVLGTSYEDVPARVRDLSPVGNGATPPPPPRPTAVGGPAPSPRRGNAGGEARRAQLEAARRSLLANRRQEAGRARERAVPATVPLSRLRKAETGQRPFDERHAIEMAINWSWDGYDAIKVADSGDGFFTVVNGQHRHAALDLLYGASSPDEPVPVLVMTGDEKAQARASRISNTGIKPWSAQSVYVLDRESGEPDVIALEAMLSTLGLRPWTSGRVGGGHPVAGTVSGIVALRKCAKRGGIHSARITVSALKSSFGDRADAFRTQLVVGVWDFILRYQDDPVYRAETLLKALRGLTPDGLIQNALVKRSAGNLDEHTAVSWAVYDAYNRAVRMVRLHLPGFVAETKGSATRRAADVRALAYKKRHGDNSVGEAH